MCDTDPKPIPAEIMAEVIRQQREEWDWPRKVPGYVQLSESVFVKWGELTVAYCEQATEFYVRKARQAIRRFIKKPSPTKAGTAADHIIRARIARCQYLTILGERATNEDEMTFAHNMY
jgi:hypothetical protein